MGRGTTTRVVLVEDHDAVREATEIMLRLAGFEVVEGTADPTRAREIVRSERPDVAVLDLRLGRQSGARLAWMLAREHPDLRLVIFTAVEELAELRDALAAAQQAQPQRGGGQHGGHRQRDLDAQQPLARPVDVVELQQQRRLVEREPHARAEGERELRLDVLVAAQDRDAA